MSQLKNGSFVLVVLMTGGLNLSRAPYKSLDTTLFGLNFAILAKQLISQGFSFAIQRRPNEKMRLIINLTNVRQQS